MYKLTWIQNNVIKHVLIKGLAQAWAVANRIPSSVTIVEVL